MRARERRAEVKREQVGFQEADELGGAQQTEEIIKELYIYQVAGLIKKKGKTSR